MTSRQLDEEAIFHVARAIPEPGPRSTYLDQVCAGDPLTLLGGPRRVMMGVGARQCGQGSVPLSLDGLGGGVATRADRVRLTSDRDMRFGADS